MPMKSKAQRKFLWATNPEVAREFEDETPKGIKLPEHVKKAMCKSFTKIAIGLKKLKPVPIALVEQKQALQAAAQSLKGLSPAAARIAKNPRLS